MNDEAKEIELEQKKKRATTEKEVSFGFFLVALLCYQLLIAGWPSMYIVIVVTYNRIAPQI